MYIFVPLCSRGGFVSDFCCWHIHSKHAARIAGARFGALHACLKVGDQVQYEDELMILEALKMENPIYAPVDGTVSEIKVAENDAVEANQVLMVIG